MSNKYNLGQLCQAIDLFQWLECWTLKPEAAGSNPSNCLEFFQMQFVFVCYRYESCKTSSYHESTVVFIILQSDTGEEAESVTSSDHDRLCELFTNLTECKDDSQQRGWALHEDEQIISENLEEMLSILVKRRLMLRQSVY